MIESISNVKKSLLIPYKQYKHKMIQKIFDVINLDFPELYYLDISGTQILISGILLTIHFSYKYHKPMIQDFDVQIEKLWSQVEVIQYPKLERLKKLHDFLVENVFYEEQNPGKESKHNLIGALCERTAVCEGYAKAFKYLCEQNDILCLIVTGEALDINSGTRGPHAWNIVKINGACYHIDVTWDSCSHHKMSSSSSYYMQSDSDMKCDHFWNMNTVPICKNSYVQLPLCHNKYELEQVICNNLLSKNLVFSVLVNREFSNTQEIVRQTQIIISKHPFIGRRSFRVSYIKARRQIDYEFSLL